MAKKPIEYSEVAIPGEEADRKLFSRIQRRAEIYQMILAKGSLRIPTYWLAERYGVTSGCISQDKKIIVEYICDEFRKNKSKTLAEIIASYRIAREKALTDGRYSEVATINDKIMKLLFELGVFERRPEQLEAKVLTMTVEDMRRLYHEALEKEKAYIEV